MGPYVIVIVSPAFHQYLRFFQCHEQLPLQKFILQLAIKRLIVSIFPGTTGFDIQRCYLQVPQPSSYGPGCEFRAIVRPDMPRDPAQEKQLIELLDHVLGGDAPSYQERQALPCVFIDDRQYPKPPAVGRGGFDEVIAPYMVLVFRSQPDAGAVIEPQSLSFGLLLRHL